MVKVIKIVEDNSITGVKYGTVEIAETPLEIKRAHAQDTYKKAHKAFTAKIRGERTKKK